MANITINEISQNYTYNIGNSSYATVAFPITASWGPGFIDTAATGSADDETLESVIWSRFPANQQGLESFVATFRGPTEQYLQHRDYSYQVAMTLLTAGYDILVCRLTSGIQAQNAFKFILPDETSLSWTVKAKYCGTFGNKLRVVLRKIERTLNNNDYSYWNIVTYIVDSNSGTQTAVENINFVFDIEKSSDQILHINEIESNFLEFDTIHAPEVDTVILEGMNGNAGAPIDLGDVSTGGIAGRDLPAVPNTATYTDVLNSAIALAKTRYAWSGGITLTETNDLEYIRELTALGTPDAEGNPKITVDRAKILYFNEWMYTAAYTILGTLEDKLAYNPNRLIVPGWDDQNFAFINNDDTITKDIRTVSPLHSKLMEVAYYGRCATAYLDIPKSITRASVYAETNDPKTRGYAQALANRGFEITNYDVNGAYYSSHSALFAPWGKYTYAGTSKQAIASPSFLALMIDRAMIKNQASQYEWQLPENRKHNLKLGKLDYNISKKYLDAWQSLEGVGVNCITQIPDLGITIWGNSTLYEVPPATYQALANLSTRKLVNAIEDLAYRCGISITFNYNNDQAYNAFYAGMTPLLDTMRNVGAIEDYYLRMAEDVNGLDQVNANSVVGKIYLVIDGVINDINIDLIALPPQTDLGEYRA